MIHTKIKWPALALLLFTCFAVQAQPKFSGYDKTKSGIFYKIHKSFGGTKAKSGDHIDMNLEMATDSGYVVFNTMELNGAPVHYQVLEPAFNGDIMEGFMMLGQGDSASFIIQADSVYRDQFYPEKVFSGSWLVYHVSIDRLQTNEEYNAEIEKMKQEQLDRDIDSIKAYFTKKRITDVDSTPNHVFYKVHNKGSGVKPVAGQDVKVHYTGKLLNGKEFDSSWKRNEPFEFLLGANRVIKGWDESIPYLHQGDSATIYLPSGMAYGERGAGKDIPPNTVLIFDVMVMDIFNKTANLAKDQETIKAFLQKKGLSATKTSSGIFYEILTTGEGAKPAPGMDVTVEYMLSVLKKNKIGKEVLIESLTFKLGGNNTFRGLEESLKQIPAGSTAVVYIPSPLGYGEEGKDELIPPDAILVLQIKSLVIN